MYSLNVALYETWVNKCPQTDTLNVTLPTMKEITGFNPLKQLSSEHVPTQCLLCGQSICSWIPSWREIFETGLLKLIVNFASNACEICTLSTSLSIYYSLFMEIYIIPYQQLKEIRKLNGTFVDVLQQSWCGVFFSFLWY